MTDGGSLSNYPSDICQLLVSLISYTTWRISERVPSVQLP